MRRTRERQTDRTIFGFGGPSHLYEYLEAKFAANGVMAGEDRPIVEAFLRQRDRLRGFIRRRVPDPADAEDILQEVFSELVEAARLMKPIEQVGAWLFRVARNRTTDLKANCSRQR